MDLTIESEPTRSRELHPSGAVSVLKATPATEETGADRPAAPIIAAAAGNNPPDVARPAKRPRKPRKRAAEKISEAYALGYEEGFKASPGSLAALIVGAGSGCIATLLFIALYKALHG